MTKNVIACKLINLQAILVSFDIDFVRQNVQLTRHFLDDMRLLASLLKDFDEP
jgi:hypothetical protein